MPVALLTPGFNLRSTIAVRPPLGLASLPTDSALCDQGGRPLGPRDQTTRVRILDATVVLLGEKPMRDLRVIDIARRIGRLKKHQSAPVTDGEREKRMMFERRDWGQSLGLPEELVDELFAVIIRHSVRIQSEPAE